MKKQLIAAIIAIALLSFACEKKQDDKKDDKKEEKNEEKKDEGISKNPEEIKKMKGMLEGEWEMKIKKIPTKIMFKGDSAALTDDGKTENYAYNIKGDSIFYQNKESKKGLKISNLGENDFWEIGNKGEFTNKWKKLKK